MNKISVGARVISAAAFGALTLVTPNCGADAAAMDISPFGGAAVVRDSVLAEMRGGYDINGHMFPVGLQLDIQSFANNHAIAGLHIDNGGGGPNGSWTMKNDNFNKTIDVSNLAPQNGPVQNNPGVSTTVTNLLTSSAVITEIQNSRSNIALSTHQVVDIRLSGAGVPGLLKEIADQAAHAALLRALHNR
jgi:hypothetical protein